MPSELIVKLIEQVNSVPALFSEPETRRFDKFVAHFDTYNAFKTLAKSLTEADLDSLKLDSPELLDDQTFALHKFLFDTIENSGLLPGLSLPNPPRQCGCLTLTHIETLCSACIANDVATCIDLVQQIGANVVDRNFQTPLMYAIGNCHVEISRILLSNNADPNLITPNLETAMHVSATTICNREIFDMLIQRGGNIDIPNSNEKTARSLLVENQRSDWLTS